MVAEPTQTPVTTPELETVATVCSLLVQVTVLSVALEGKTVAVNVVVAPTMMLASVLSTDIPVTGMMTFNSQVALLSPAVAVIALVPSETATTWPDWDTIATDSLLLVQVTAASLGSTVTVKSMEPPTGNVYEVGLIVILLTVVPPLVTVTEHVALFPPAKAVMVAVPAATAVIKPDVETVATPLLLLDQVTVLSVAFSGRTVAVKDWVSPTVRDMLEALSVIVVTGIVASTTVTEQVADLPPAVA